MIFLDTSAVYALADRDDKNHAQAVKLFQRAQDDGDAFLVHNYVLLESAALLSRRLNSGVAARFLAEAETFEVHWVDESFHRQAVHRWKERRGKPSFVDVVSFQVMRKRGVNTVLAFDEDFPREGFSVYTGK